MANDSLLKIALDTKGLANKAIAVMLALVLAFMALSPVAIDAAFADGGAGAKPSAAADSDTTGGKDPAASLPEKAQSEGEGTSPDADDPSGETPALPGPSATDDDAEGSGGDSGSSGDAPEGTGEGEGGTASPDGEGTEPSNGEGAGEGEVAPGDAQPGEGDTGGEAAPGDTQPGDGTEPGGSGQAADDGNDEAPETPAEGKPQGSDPQASGTAPGDSAQIPAGMGKVHPEITASANVLSKPANGKTYGAGETIKFRIIVRNSGDVPLYSVRVSNLISGAVSAPVVAAGDGYAVGGTIASIASLDPGKRVVIPVNYKVLAADAGASIFDTAVVKAVNPADPQNPVSASASTSSVKVTSIPSPTAAPKALAPPAPAAPIASVGAPLAKIEHDAKPLPTVEPQRKTPPEKKGEAKGDGRESWKLTDLVPIGVVGALCLAVLIAAFIHKRREAAQDATG